MTVYASIRALRTNQVGTLYPIADHPLHVVCSKSGQLISPVLRRMIRGESRAFYYMSDDCYIQTRIKDRMLYDKVLSAENLITLGISQAELPDDVSVTFNIGLLNPPRAIADDAYAAFSDAVFSVAHYTNYQYSIDNPLLKLIDWSFQGEGTFKKARGMALKTDGAFLIDVSFKIGGIYLVKPGQFWRYCKHMPDQAKFTYSTRAVGSEDKFEVFVVGNLEYFRRILKGVRKVKSPEGKVTWQIAGENDVLVELGHLGIISSVSSLMIDRDDEGEPVMKLEMRVILCAASDDLELHSDHIPLLKGTSVNGCIAHDGGEYVLLADPEEYAVTALNITVEGFKLASESVALFGDPLALKEDDVIATIPCAKLSMYIPISTDGSVVPEA